MNVTSLLFSLFCCWDWLFANIDCWSIGKTARVENAAMALSKDIYATSFIQNRMTYDQVSAVLTVF